MGLIINEILESYLTPVNVVGLKGSQVHQRTFNDSIIRIAVVDDNDSIVQMMVFDHGGKFNIKNVFITLSRNISRHLTGEWTNRFFIKYDVLEFFREADLGPINPRLPPGPDNPLLKDRLVFFRAGELRILIDIRLLFILYTKIHRISNKDFPKDPLVKKWLSRYPTKIERGVSLYIGLDIGPMSIIPQYVDIYDSVAARAIPSTRDELDNDTELVMNAINNIS